MQNFYLRIGKTPFKIVLILVILASDILAGIGLISQLGPDGEILSLVEKAKNLVPEIGQLSQGDLKEVFALLNKALKLGVVLITSFHLLIGIMLYLEKKYTRGYFAMYTGIGILTSITSLFQANMDGFYSWVKVICFLFVFLGCWKWPFTFGNLAQENLSAKEESNPEDEH